MVQSLLLELAYWVFTGLYCAAEANVSSLSLLSIHNDGKNGAVAELLTTALRVAGSILVRIKIFVWPMAVIPGLAVCVCDSEKSHTQTYTFL